MGTAEKPKRIETRKLVKTKHPGIYERGNTYVVRFRDPSGKQTQRSARTLAEARRLKAELTTDVLRGEYRADTKVTFTEYADQWPKEYAGRTGKGVRAMTLEGYERDLKRAKTFFGRTRLSAIGPPDIRRYGLSLLEDGLATATMRRYMAPVKAMFATAADDGLIRVNPTAGVRIALPRPALTEDEDDDQVKALDQDQLRKLIGATPEGPHRLLVTLIAETGLRISEVAGLRWQNIDTKARRLSVRQRVREGQVDRPKSRAGMRDVPISTTLAKDLAAFRLKSRWSADTDLVFATRTGKPFSARNAYRWYKTAAKKAGVPWAGFHALRHTAASRWLLSGVSIAQVAKLLGHEDPSFTLRTYISVLPTDLPDGDTLAAAVGVR